MKGKNISIIVAIDTNNAIGRENNLLWHISEDLKHFKQITTGHTVVMGRKTYESIGRALPNRQNIIITRNTTFSAPGCVVVHSLAQAIQEAVGQEIFVIGGGEIYHAALSLCNKLYITYVHHQYDADTFFPLFEKNQWKEIAREEHAHGASFEHPFAFVEYEKIK